MHIVRRVKRMHKYEDMESAVFLDQVVQELIAPAHIGGLTARAVANLLWSLARLGHHPGQLWLDRVLPQQPEFMTTFLRSSLASLPAHSPQAVLLLACHLPVTYLAV
ncbi:hypothetical protein HaLaN_13387 [Haematococcus lacustris]|uniref:Uncharacterized protein n=1 Tax=Haematococcus lacustris TaxID=44745 RepID=A0A699Z2T2_HAELA|nr:hypothetical protein HaLaN_13387 [Haematococcus lacustris]